MSAIIIGSVNQSPAPKRIVLGSDAWGIIQQEQCLFYRHCHPVLTRLFPERSSGREEVPELARHIVRFSLAGIRATGRRARKSGAG